MARLSLESGRAKADATVRAGFLEHSDDITRWLNASRSDRALSPEERELLRKKVGGWRPVDRRNVGWRAECLGVMGWALGLVDELPPYDTQFGSQLAPFGPSGEPPGSLRRHVALRSPRELAEAEAVADQWHWRAVQVQAWYRGPSETGDSPGEGSAARTIAIRRALGEEAQLFEKPYDQLSFEEFSLARSIAIERHYALNWIWNGEPWDEVTTDTLGLSVPAPAPPPEPVSEAADQGGWSIQRLVSLLPRLPETHSVTKLAPRVVDLMVRTGQAVSVDDLLRHFENAKQPLDAELKTLLTSGFFAALAEKSPNDLEWLLSSQSAERVKKAILKRVLELGWFERAAQATSHWSARELIMRLPLRDLGKFSGTKDQAAAEYCTRRGLRHSVVYRMAARRGDVETLRAWARETAELEPSDSNGGFSRATFLPWAFQSLVEETAKAGLVELANEFLGLLTSDTQRASQPYSRLRDFVAEAAAQAGLSDLARVLVSDGSSPAIDAALLLAGSPSVKAALEQLRPPSNDATWEGCCAAFWASVKSKEVRTAWDVLRHIVRLIQQTRRRKEEHLDTVGIWAWQLVERMCREHQFEDALRELEETSRATGLHWPYPMQREVAYEAAIRGRRDLAHSIAETLPSDDARRLSPLLVEDWSRASMPPDATLDEHLWWAVLALEAVHGRSAAAEGFGVPRDVP